MSDNSIDYTKAVESLKAGGVIAYPTESCFGLGCDPDNQAAVEKILALKQRDISKGLILIASNYSQLLPYIADNLIPQDKRFSVFSHWPGPFTLLLPVKPETPEFLTGQFDTLAVRVTAHEGARGLCEAFGKPIVSTSCNLSGQDAATSYQAVMDVFAEQLDYVLDAPIGQNPKPSTILNPLTGIQIR
ncbi:L-threonylcarbamoyladenylate synthase [Catenovulum maritimum]|uniref:Threonylcarbamoyl-AMP synthase n=1 Tax=Catenovulum maritimum TaxID=1513271 RepID=A0A0J8GZD8_9ALTE|nr:L-threonylcarbamoyladenylate synthase [Catenovulum maritimum]KMT66088.1 tRNA(ANN) t(6)A37 threonylcarbamoyladenosine modification protein [Catenovulum maritimum]